MFSIDLDLENVDDIKEILEKLPDKETRKGNELNKDDVRQAICDTLTDIKVDLLNGNIKLQNTT